MEGKEELRRKQAAGWRARVRLEEERSKRKEIVRLDVAPREAGSRARAGRGSSPSTSVPAVPGRRRKRRRAAPADEGVAGVDGWVPDVADVTLAAAAGDGRGSSLVRVHGLPRGAKPEEVRRAFAGLNPGRVLILVSNGASVAGWDAEAGSAPPPATPSVRRYPPTFRVYVQFDTAAAAGAATARSGEAVFASGAERCPPGGGCGGDAGEGDAGDGRGPGAAVAVTAVPRAHASFILRCLAFDAARGEALHRTSEDMERKLPGCVGRVLWARAAGELGCLLARAEGGNDGAAFSDAFKVLEGRMGRCLPDSADSYRALATAYNSLCDLYESVEWTSAGNAALLLRHDPTLSGDPICRLTDASMDWISVESKRIDLALRLARHALADSQKAGKF